MGLVYGGPDQDVMIRNAITNHTYIGEASWGFFNTISQPRLGEG